MKVGGGGGLIEVKLYGRINDWIRKFICVYVKGRFLYEEMICLNWIFLLVILEIVYIVYKSICN